MAWTMTTEEYFESRLPYDPRRDVLWKALWDHYFARLISGTDCVLELGAGYGSFINNVVARRRIAVDAWPGMVPHLAAGVESRVGDVAELSFLRDHSVNFVFASNLFEHLTQDAFSLVLDELKRLLASGGTLNILQPNYYYAYREYFDDYTHRTVYSHVSLCDLLRSHGYRIVACHKKFLPLTIKSRLPVSPLLIRAYLSSPWKPMAKQMLVRAQVAD
jgi:SAM-dependent methyltransferase